MQVASYMERKRYCYTCPQYAGKDTSTTVADRTYSCPGCIRVMKKMEENVRLTYIKPRKPRRKVEKVPEISITEWEKAKPQIMKQLSALLFK